MKVALFIDSLGDTPGGAERVVADLCEAELAKGIDVEVLHFGHEWLDAHLEGAGFPQRRLPGHRNYKSIWRLPRFVWMLSRLLRREAFDLLHAHLLGASFAGSIAARWAGIPCLSTLHDSYTLEENPALAFWTARWSTGLTAVADDIQGRLRAQVPGAEAKLSVIYNGVPSVSGGDRGQTRRTLGIPEEDVVFCCVANLRAIKRHDLLLRGFCRSRVEGGHLLIVGDGAERPALEELAEELEIAARVHFLGNRDDVPELLFASDVFVLVSDSEGLSRSIVEGMSQGLPVLATRVGGNPLLVDDGGNGLLVAAGDASGLGEAMGALADDPARRQEMGERSRALVRKRFDLAATVEQYLQRYDDLTGH